MHLKDIKEDKVQLSELVIEENYLSEAYNNKLTWEL
jgi:hypothetical protein